MLFELGTHDTLLSEALLLGFEGGVAIGGSADGDGVRLEST